MLRPKRTSNPSGGPSRATAARSGPESARSPTWTGGEQRPVLTVIRPAALAPANPALRNSSQVGQARQSAERRGDRAGEIAFGEGQRHVGG